MNADELAQLNSIIIPYTFIESKKDALDQANAKLTRI
jgi:hypothetical protein